MINNFKILKNNLTGTLLYNLRIYGWICALKPKKSLVAVAIDTSVYTNI